MFGFQLTEQTLHRARQSLVGGVHAGEQGVAAGVRRLDTVQDRSERGLTLERDVAVPPRRHVAAVALTTLQHHDLRVPLARQLLQHGVDVEIAEAQGECLVFVSRDVLIAEEDDLMF